MPNITELLRILSNFGNLGQSSMGSYRTPPFVPYGSQPQPQFGGGYTANAVNDTANQIGSGYQEPFDIEAEWAKLYQPEYQMRDRFQELLNSFPQRENPSGWRKFGAFLTGLGGENAAEAMQLSNTAANLPYINRMQDWNAQAGPVLKAVDDERAYNQSAMQNANYMMSRKIDQQRADIAQQRADEYARGREAQEKLAAERNETQRGYLDLARAKQAQPNLIFKEDIDGYVHYINPITGESGRTAVKHLHLDDFQKSQLGLRNQMAMEGVRQENRKELIEMRDTNTREQIELREALRAARPNLKNATPQQLQQALMLKLQQALIEHPEWTDYIQAGVVVEGTPPEIHQQILQYIRTEKPPLVGGGGNSGMGRGTFVGSNNPDFPGRQSIGNSGSIVPQAPGQIQGQASIPGQNNQPPPVKVLGPDGKIYMIPVEKLQEAMSRGGKVVR